MATVNFVRYQSQSRAALQKVADYVRRSDKTDGQRYVSGQNCSPLFATQEFTATRMRYKKDNPVWFYHYTQSFSPDENITPELAHAVAKEFAAQAWPESEVLIATHIDARHIHSHFLVNAVCYGTGRMLRQGPHTLECLRQISDKLCLKHGLSVLDNGKRHKAKGVSAREYRAAEKGQSWKFELMNVIDDCMLRARTRREFIERMRRRGYGVRWARERKSITYTTPEGMRCRDLRLHDEKYLKEAMEREFRIRAEIFFGGIEAEEPSAGRAVTDNHVRDVSDAGGVGRADTAAGPDREQCCESPDAAAPASDNGTGDATAGGQADGGGGCAADDAPTGWENERAALLASRSLDRGRAADAHKAPGHSDSAGGGDSVVRDLFQLAVNLERLQDPVPVTDSTTRPLRSDRKVRSQERAMRIALGHRPDDHEDEPTWQQQQY